MSDNDIGGLVISEDVLASIVVNSLKDVPGISSLVQRPSDLETLFRIEDGALKCVKVKVRDNEVYIHIYIKILSGYRIPALTERIRTNVKNAVQTMTGKIVARVDIDIVGIDFSEPQDSKK